MAEERYTIVVHGGVVTTRGRWTHSQLALIRAVVTQARDQLAAGAAASDVVVQAVVGLEDSGLLNAGKGSSRNAAGVVEMDASLMEGDTGNAGAVAAMRRVKNPIKAARIVMEETPHVLLVGSTGEETLIGLGAEAVGDPASYFKPYRDLEFEPTGPGTVGAVALDRRGRLAAGTSTGGTSGKLPGRVGDSPIIGAGTFADERYALSATGSGEHFILRSVARDIAMRSEYRGSSLQEAADYVIGRLIGDIDQAQGAVIAVSRSGEIVLAAANVLGVCYGYASESKAVTVGMELR
jgi:L-asparaginase/beta-aspartyl-peptidase (threonine type)